MNYPDELCQLIIRNVEILETAPSVRDKIERQLFATINTRIKERVEAQKGKWKGYYKKLMVGDKKDDDDTSFALDEWPEDNDVYLVYFQLGCTEDACPDDEEHSWLAFAAGYNGMALCLEFSVDLALKDLGQRLREFYKSTPALHEAKFLCTKDGSIYRPFSFDAEKLAEEYPVFDVSLAPLDAALDDIFKTHKEFDAFVKKLKTARRKK
ncbi:MAG: hypothetical protein LBS65_07890 [Desulfovibrio sp.]|jgi:hypothetical protein|nr:hypothetical protein [Desulfovibrio sp.]